MTKLLAAYLAGARALADLPPLGMRLIMAYVFHGTALAKLSNLQATADWFASLHYPMPLLNAYMAAGTEALGFVLLALGLATRFIAPVLMFVMLIAITTVHWGHGYECGHNGFEVPLYFLIMLACLWTGGAGRFSLDYLIVRRHAV